MSGPPPKRDSQRRRRNTPASYGKAEPEIAGTGAPAPDDLGITDCDAMIVDLWDALQASAEAKYYSDADWQRVRLELRYGSMLLRGGRTPGAQAWATFQAGLNALLVSAADKRRAGIELKPHMGDPDEMAADDALADVLRLIPDTGS